MVYLGYYGYFHGDLDRLIAPVDGALNLCGIAEGFRDYEKLYITDFSSQNINKIYQSAICVKECPDEVPFKLECMTHDKVPSCTIPDDEQYKTKPVLDICFPTHPTKELPE